MKMLKKDNRAKGGLQVVEVGYSTAIEYLSRDGEYLKARMKARFRLE